MTTLICTGTLFSEWQHVIESQVSEASSRLPVHAELNTCSEALCRQHFPEADELTWKSFSPDKKDTDNARQLLSATNSESLFIWTDANSSLYLNFWKTTAEDAKFLLFYSSPEFELSNYISTHPFDASRVEKIIDAWVIRTRAMLTFFMNNRDRCLLVSVRSADSANGPFIQALNKQFGLDLEPKSLIEPLLNKNSPLIEYLATTLLLKNQHVAELYDEVRSAATLICDQDKSISSIEDRNKSLINAFLKEVTACQQLNDTQSELEDELYLNQLQIKQMQEELEFYFNESMEQEKVADTVAKYLSNDPLLKIVRQVRQMQ